MARSYNLADLLEILAAAGPDRPALVAGDDNHLPCPAGSRGLRGAPHQRTAIEQRHQLVAKGVHIYFVDDTTIAMNNLLGAAVVGIEHTHRRIAIVAQHIQSDAERVEVGEQHRDGPKLAGIGRPSLRRDSGAGKLAELQDMLGELERSLVAMEVAGEGDAEPDE